MPSGMHRSVEQGISRQNRMPLGMRTNSKRWSCLRHAVCGGGYNIFYRALHAIRHAVRKMMI